MPPDMPRIIYQSPHVPAEWIAAHGCAPCRITPETGIGEAHAGMGVCPYAAAFIQAAAMDKDAAAIVLTTSCDQMRRQAEILSGMAACPVFLMHTPTAVAAPTAAPLYREEILRLGRFMQTLGGAPPLPGFLAEVMAQYDAGRRRLRAVRAMLSARAFSATLMCFQRGDWSVLDALTPETIATGGVPLALAGGPLRCADLCLFDEIETAGGQVVLDATSTGERSLPPPFDPEALHASPLDILLDAYLGHIPEAFQRPNAGLYRYLIALCQDRGVRGIVLRHYIWCDTWQIEAARLEEKIALPVLRLDVAEEDDSARQAGRLQAFLETLI